MPGVRKIAVLRANAVGDLVFALPAIEALRAAYPGAEITLLGQHWHERFLRGRPGPLDRVIVVPYSRGVYDIPGHPEQPAELEAFFRTMQAERFDMAVQMHGGGRHSNPFVQRLGARVTAGLRTPDAIALDRWMPYVYWQREVLRYLELVNLVGATPVSLEPRLVVTERDHEEAAASLPPGTGPLAILHPGAGDPRRRWPPERFAAVGDALQSRGLTVVLNGVPTEEPIVRLVQRAMERPAPWLGPVSLGALMAVLSRSRLLVTNDSGPLHVAMAVGTPTASIFWFGNMLTAGPVTTTWHRAHPSWRLTCPICGSDCMRDPCDHAVSWVDDVSVEAVLASAVDLLEMEAMRSKGAWEKPIEDSAARTGKARGRRGRRSEDRCTSIKGREDCGSCAP